MIDNNQLEAYLERIVLRGYTPKSTEREALIEIGHNLVHILTEMDEDQVSASDRDLIVKAHKTGFKSKNGFIASLCASALYKITKKEKYIKQLAHLIRKDDKESLTYDVSTLNSLASILFNPDPEHNDIQEKHFNRSLLMTLMTRSIKKARRRLERNKVIIPKGYTNNNRVVLITQLFTVPPHGPTVDVLTYANVLTRDYGKEVLIVNTCEYGNTFNGGVVPVARGNVQAEYAHQNATTFGDQPYPFCQHVDGYFSGDSIVHDAKRIIEFDPAMIITTGTRNILAELFHERCFLFLYPTAQGIPLTVNHNFHTWQEPTPHMLKVFHQEGITDKCLFSQHPGFNTFPPNSVVVKSDFNLPEDAYVYAVVGMRLHIEVTPEFIQCLEKILRQENSYILFLGRYENYEDVIKGNRLLKEKTRFGGFQKDMAAVFGICNAYLNPDRMGGGTSASHAMGAGLPVLSLPSGDVGNAASEFPRLEAYDDMVRAANAIYEDEQTKLDYDICVKKSFDIYCSRTPLIIRIMDAFEDHCIQHGL